MNSQNLKWTDSIPLILGLALFGVLSIAIPILLPLWVILGLALAGGASEGLDRAEDVRRKRRQDRGEGGD